MKILVRNLCRFVTADDLEKLFEKFGTVQYTTVVLDNNTGKSKGFGFVEMPKPGDAKVAIKRLNGIAIHGETIRVKRATDSLPATANTTTKPAPEKSAPSSIWPKK